MREKIEALMAEVAALSCKTEQEVEEARIRLLGKKGEITALFDEFRTVAPELKREFGQKLNILKNTAAAKIEELKETSANGDFNRGSSSTNGITAASAIAALQEAGSKLTRDMVKSGFRAFCELNRLAIELIREFYDEPRFFRIVMPNGTEEFISYDNSSLLYEKESDLFGVVVGGRKPIFDIKVSSEKSSPFTKISQNELALQLYNAGFFNREYREQALLALNMMDFEGKSEVISRVSSL